MGNKKKTHNAPAAQHAPNPVLPTDLPSRGSSRGFDMAYFDGVLDDHEKEILKSFPPNQRELYGVIKSSYPTAVIRRNQNVWGNSILTFELPVQAFSSAQCSARLDVQIGMQYPKALPIIQVLSCYPQGLQAPMQNKINTLLENSWGNEQMVWNSLEEAERMLEDSAVVEESRDQGVSLETERADYEAAARKEALDAQVRLLREQERQAAARDNKLAEDVEAHRQRRKPLPTQNSVAPSMEEYQKLLGDNTVVFDRMMHCHNTSNDEDIDFSAVLCQTTVLQREDKKVSIALPISTGPIACTPMLLKQINLPSTIETADLLEATLVDTGKLLDEAVKYEHASVVRVYGHKLVQIAKDHKTAEWRLFILTELASGGPLNRVLSVAGRFDATMIRSYTRQVLDALEYFDRKGYVYPALHAGNVLFFGSSDQGYHAKLSDGYGTALRDLVERSQKSTTNSNARWAAPEISSDPPFRSKQTCLFELGVVMLHMALGNNLTEGFTSPSDALNRAEFDVDFSDLVSKMCATNVDKRTDAFSLQSHKFFRSNTTTVFRPVPQLMSVTLSQPQGVPEASTWNTQWESIEKLGKGGFGQVVKARNRMDGQYYAVKRLVCQSSRELDEIWKEVSALARLNHPGIVRYYNAWQESENAEAESESQTATTDFRETDEQLRGSSSAEAILGLPSTGHDFMDPSLRQFRGPEFDSEDEDDNPFGYQSPPADSEGDNSSQAIEDVEGIEDVDDPFGLPSRPDIDNQPNPFGFDESVSNPEPHDDIPSRPRTFHPNPKSISLFKSRSLSMSQKSTLYIQMELCETGTLANVIKKGLPEQVGDSWRIFRLILDGLEHIHSWGLVHRDLKPANIFIDAKKNPKIGDFGLAAPGQAHDGENTATPRRGRPQSQGIGTLYYTAPELEKGGSGIVSAKADIFSLGIIFFEMCFPFPTETERYQYLQTLNQPEFQLPNRFQDEKYVVQGKIITKLLNQDPLKRPSAAELLQDPEIPEPLEEEREVRFVERLLRGPADQYKILLARMFQRRATQPEILAYNERDEVDLHDIDEVLYQSMSHKVKDIFRRHGGVEVMRQITFPVENLYSNAVMFLDEAGYTVQLPYDLTVPFAMQVAQKTPPYPKMFSVGFVYRKNPKGGDPLRVPEVDFDIVSHSARDISLKDAEVIAVLDDMLREIPTLASRSWSVIINHGDLLDLVLGFCGVPKSQFALVKRTLSPLNVGSSTWSQVQTQLRSPSTTNLSTRCVAALAQFSFTCDATEVRERVLGVLRGSKDADWVYKASRPLARLEEIQRYLTLLRPGAKVVYCPLSNNSEQLYRGSLMFQCMEVKAKKILAVGGRYDDLIRSYQMPRQGTNARAVGFRLNMVDLVRYATADSQKTQKKTKAKDAPDRCITPRVAVVITSFDEDTLHSSSCFEIQRNVYEAGFSVETSDLYESIEELDKAYGNDSNYWLIIVRSGGLTKRTLKVRSPTRDESDVPASELVDLLRSEMGSRQAISVAKEPRLKRTESSHTGDKENVAVLVPKHKSKKMNRAAVVDLAKSAAREKAESMSTEYKTLAIDTDDETLQKIRNTRLTDGESWKAVRHSVALTEREYVMDIQRQLSEWANGGQDGAFLCNYKTKACIFYDFGT